MSTVKESSDELNPTVASSGRIVEGAPERGAFGNLFALLVATCGVGYIPLAPGTWGSLVGVGLYLGWRSLSLRTVWAFQSQRRLNAMQTETLYTASLLLLITVVTLVGVWGASRSEKLLGRKDPGKVVVDEVAGQLITFLFVPAAAVLNWWIILAGFLLFRLFDIWKPYPARRLEVLESGLGIMADDVVAGAYAAIVVALMVAINQIL
jgi:phosphatidylglycerophosphatase A